MRGRLGLLIGFGAGYYLGTRAGRERYDQINRTLTKARRSDTVETAADKAKAVVDLGKERAKDIAESHGPNGGQDREPGSAQGAAYEQSSFTGTYTPNNPVASPPTTARGEYQPHPPPPES